MPSVRPLAPLQVRNNGVGPFEEPDPHRCAGFVPTDSGGFTHN